MPAAWDTPQEADTCMVGSWCRITALGDGTAMSCNSMVLVPLCGKIVTGAVVAKRRGQGIEH